jgi:hypothetical protein
MHAFDFILVLFSFVYAAAVTQLLSTAGEIIIASKRIRLSWFNAGWMLVALLFTCAWWIGLWDLHVVKSWDIGSIAFYFSIAAGIYLNARLVSPRIPETGEIDLQRFHSEEGRKYLIAYTILLRAHGGDECQAWPIRRRVAVAGAEYRYRSDDHSIGRGCNFH